MKTQNEINAILSQEMNFYLEDSDNWDVDTYGENQRGGWLESFSHVYKSSNNWVLEDSDTRVTLSPDNVISIMVIGDEEGRCREFEDPNYLWLFVENNMS